MKQFYRYIYLSIHLSIYPSIHKSIPPSQLDPIVKEPEKSAALHVNSEGWLRKGYDVWPSMVSHTLNLTHPSAHTHTAVRSEQTYKPWTVISHGSDCGREHCTFTPPRTSLDCTETWALDLWVTSPTLYQLGHGCPCANLYLQQHRVLLYVFFLRLSNV